MTKKYKLSECFSCFCGEKCGSKQWLSRKKKKQLKKAISLLNQLYFNFKMWEYPTSCNQWGDYKYLLPIIRNFKFYQKYFKVYQSVLKSEIEDEIAFIFDYKKGACVLAFLWDRDNGLYTESGYMPLQFGEDTNDGTWAWESTHCICKEFGLDIFDIKNELDFIKKIQLQLDKRMENNK